MIRRGEPWGAPHPGPPAATVRGGDAELAAALVAAGPGAPVAWDPDPGSDLALALGLRSTPGGAPPGEGGGVALPVDLLGVTADDGATTADGTRWAVNAVLLGADPTRAGWGAPAHHTVVTVDDRTVHLGPATAVLVTSGPFVGGRRASLRAHPGDGWAHVLVVAVPRAQRRALRRRLATATHLPHPDLHVARGRCVGATSSRPVPLLVDGRRIGRVRSLEVVVAPGRGTVLVRSAPAGPTSRGVVTGAGEADP